MVFSQGLISILIHFPPLLLAHRERPHFYAIWQRPIFPHALPGDFVEPSILLFFSNPYSDGFNDSSWLMQVIHHLKECHQLPRIHLIVVPPPTHRSSTGWHLMQIYTYRVTHRRRYHHHQHHLPSTAAAGNASIKSRVNPLVALPRRSTRQYDDDNDEGGVKNKLRVINDVKDIYIYNVHLVWFYKNPTFNVPDDGEWENNNLYPTNAKHLSPFFFLHYTRL